MVLVQLLILYQDGPKCSCTNYNYPMVGNLLLDQQANTRGTLVVREILTGGTVGALTTPDLLAQIHTGHCNICKWAVLV